jgi:hypothetical protein
MIVIGGLQYLSTDAVSGKNDGRARITQALQGLLLALLSYLILNTINPQILNTELTLNTVKSPTISDGTTFNPNNLTAIPGAGSTAPIGPNNYSIPKDGGFDPALNANASTPQKTLSTTFGLNDSQDSGVGSPIMGDGKGNGILTNDPNVRGVSLPQEVWEGYFNIPHHAGTDSDPLPYSKWEVVRNSAVEVTGPNGKTSILPVVDLGPGAGAAAGVGADVTHAVDQDLGINGKGEISYRILPGYYTTNPKPALTQVPGK